MVQPEHIRIQITAGHTIRQAIEIIAAGSTQIALIVGQHGRLLGTVTDGDIRRGILRGLSLEDSVGQVMNSNPMTAQSNAARSELMSLMTTRLIKQVPLMDPEGRVVGLVLLDDLLGHPVIKDSVAVILAGGEGVRLRPLTNSTPKPLLKVGGKPVLELIIEQLRDSGVNQIYISVNHLADKVEEYLEDGRNHQVSIQYLREPQSFGTAGPLSLLPKSLSCPCILVNGDLVTKVSFDRLLDFHTEGGFDMTIGVKEYPLQFPFGVITTEGDQVVGFQEKPIEIRMINSGVYVLEPSVVNKVPSGYYDMDQLITTMITDSPKSVGAFPIHEYWLDIGTHSDYHQAQTDYPVHFDEER